MSETKSNEAIGYVILNTSDDQPLYMCPGGGWCHVPFEKAWIHPKTDIPEIYRGLVRAGEELEFILVIEAYREEDRMYKLSGVELPLSAAAEHVMATA